MPAVPKTSRTKIIRAAQKIIKEQGIDAVSMVEVASRVGIRSPSLYKHFRDKGEILQAVESETFAELGMRLKKSGPGLENMVKTYMAFARQQPDRYRLLFSLRALDDPEAAAVRLEAARPVLETLSKLLGGSEAGLLRARVLTAFLHGYALIEAADAFRLGGKTEDVVAEGLRLILPELLGHPVKSR